MNADDLPLGFARHLVVETKPGTESKVIDRCVTKELAENFSRFMSRHFPENKYDITEETPVLPAFQGKL